MSYRVLARTYRPERFDEVIGQDHVVDPLSRSIENDRVGHAYIFSGPRGIGKTTTARLLAKRVNCVNPEGAEPCNECDPCVDISQGRDVDVLEIDGASNNGVDRIRELREQVQYAPARNAMKVYIIDEVHMLTDAAFNALLKTLEEPPEHAMFIFATTEIDRVPDTILSRCQRFNFRLLSLNDLVASLQEICESEDIPVTEEALYLIGKFAEGSLRDAQSILDQMINFTEGGEKELTGDLVSSTWGLASYDELTSMLWAMVTFDDEDLLGRIDDHLAEGNDLMLLIGDLTEMIRHMLMVKRAENDESLGRALPDHVHQELVDLAGELRTTELTWMFEELIELHDRLQRHSRFQRELAEVSLVRILRGRPKYNLAEIIDRLESLEADGAPPADEQQPTRTETTDSGRPDPPGVEEDDDSPSDREESEPEEPQPSQADRNEDQEGSEPDPERKSEPVGGNEKEGNWEQILRGIPQPTRAYLQEAREVSLGDERLEIVFEPQWENHVDQLREPDRTRTIQDAIEEVTDRRPDISIDLAEGEPSSGEEPAPEPPTPSAEDRNRSEEANSSPLLDRAKEVFDVRSVERID